MYPSSEPPGLKSAGPPPRPPPPPPTAERGRRRHAHLALVLLRAADVIRHVRRRDDVIELPRGIVHGRPRRIVSLRVERDVATGIGRVQDVVVVVRIDPYVVRVAARELLLGERLAAVARAERADVLDVDEVLVLRVGEDVRVVERALPEPPLVVDERPRRARVVGAEQPAVLVLDEREHAVRIDG